MIGRRHQLMVARTDEEEDRKGEDVQRSGAGGMGPPILSEGGDVRGWMGTPSTYATFGWKRKVAQVDCLKGPTLPELQHP